MTPETGPAGRLEPNTARMYDYLLGGTQHTAADRAEVGRLRTLVPELPAVAVENRRLLRRMTRFLAGEAGVGQFVGIGVGLPTQDSLHEVARRTNPGARVAYVDNDPVALAHGRELLAGVRDTGMVPGDLRAPDAILAAPELHRLVDLGEPVALVLAAVLHFVGDDEDPHGVIRRLLVVLPPGSYLALGHAVGGEDATPGGSDRVLGLTRRARPEIARFFGGLELVEPGLVPIPAWRPDGDSTGGVPDWGLAGVARKP